MFSTSTLLIICKKNKKQSNNNRSSNKQGKVQGVLQQDFANLEKKEQGLDFHKRLQVENGKEENGGKVRRVRA